MSSMRIALGLALAALAAACASGPTTRSRPDEPIRALMSADVMMLVSFDTDGDLSISAAEVDAGLDREFTRADSNRDGSMQPIEYQNWGNLVLGGGQLGPYRLDFDRNVDNVITREEFERLMTEGAAPRGRKLNELMVAVAKERFAHMTDQEVDALYAYLKARAERPQ